MAGGFGPQVVARFRALTPFRDLKGYKLSDAGQDLSSALTTTFLGIPQGVAYAMIAGLPPAMGLYASCVPTIIGSLFRSSRHVVTGPTNALSLLVGTAGAAAAGLDPIPTAMLLAFLVGVIQLGAGVLRLGVLVDYISIPVVIGYITGAGVLIGVGQLPNLTQTPGATGNLVQKVWGWWLGLAETNYLALLFALATAVLIVVLRRFNKKLPGAIIALALATLLTWALDLHNAGLIRLADKAPMPTGLPPFSIPSFHGWQALLPVAVAIAVLSLVESSAVARAIAAKSGQRLDISTEFSGQGLSNIFAAFFGGYPISGSLSRSAVNHTSGARSRMGGVFNGLFMLLVLLVLGPVANHTPVAALAGLLMVVAWDLVDVPRIKKILKARPSDGAAFVITVLGTWALRLDQAIYLGVALSVFLFLRRARLLNVQHLVFDKAGKLMELRLDDPLAKELGCPSISLLQVEGQLFFGAAGELSSALDDVIADTKVQVVVLRIRRAYGLDLTTIQALEAAAERLHSQGRHLLLVGVRPDASKLLKRTGALEVIGEDNLFPTCLTWFEAADAALERALTLLDDSEMDHDCSECCFAARLRRE